MATVGEEATPATAAPDAPSHEGAAAAHVDDLLAGALLNKLSIIPHHAITLRRNKYRVIRYVTRRLGWDVVGDKDASFLWLDKWETADMTNLRYGKVGHFLAMRELSSKCSLGRTLNRMKQEFQTDYDFHPVTFILPHDRERLMEYAAAYATVSSAVPGLGPGSKPGGAGASAGGATIAPPPSASWSTTKSVAAAMSVLMAGGVASTCGVGDGGMGKGRPSGGATPIAAPHTDATGGECGLGPPVHGGCWPQASCQAQPQATAGDRLVFIVKPDVSSRGNGIYLALNLADIREMGDGDGGDGGSKAPGTKGGAGAVRSGSGDAVGGAGDESEGEDTKKLTLVQTYLPRPLLMDGRKFDLRIYVLVTSAFPTLRLFIYRQGLVRFATEVYAPPNEANIRHRRMFLTNYAVNKSAPGASGGADDEVADGDSTASDPPDGSDGDVEEEGSRPHGTAPRPAPGSGSGGGGGKGKRIPWPLSDRAGQRRLVQGRTGCKWTLDALFNCLKAQGIDTDTLWKRITDVITKTILAIRPSLAQKYRAARPQVARQPPPPPPPKPRLRRAHTTGSAGVGGMAASRSLSSTRPRPRHTAVAPPLPPSAVPATSDLAPGDVGVTLHGGHATDALTQACAAILAASDAHGRRAHSASSPRQGAPSDAFGLPAMAATSVPLPGGVRTGVGASTLAMAGRAALGGGSIAPAAAAPGAAAAAGGLTLGAIGGGFGIMGTAMTLQVGGRGATARVAPHQGTAGVSSRHGGGHPSPSPIIPAQGAPGLGLVGGGMTLSARTTASTSTSTSMATPDTSDSLAAPPGSVVVGRKPPVPRQAHSASGPMPGSGPGTGSSGGEEMGSKPSRPAFGSRKRAETPVEEEDGEQGFRCYELMGLDVILDMSHCTCANAARHQHVVSWPDKPWPLDSHRCQPRPVLLEINQSCSMHTDSEIDRIVKGDVVTDAFAMSAPDEGWLLERFKEVLTLKAADDVPAAVATYFAGAPAEASCLTRSSFNDIRDHASLDDVPQAHATATRHATLARAEAERLVSMYNAGTAKALVEGMARAVAAQAPSSGVAPRSGQGGSHGSASGDESKEAGVDGSRGSGRGGGKEMAPPRVEGGGDGDGSEVGGVSGRGSRGGLPTTAGKPVPTDLTPIPWLPPPSTGASLVASPCLRDVWVEEAWFGSQAGALPPPPPTSAAPGSENGHDTPTTGGETTGGGGEKKTRGVGAPVPPSPPSNLHPLSAYTLSTLPPLSQRAELVLLLRRIYEHLHCGGFQRLTPPTDAALRERYRQIAEYVPPALRETAAFARRRQEALVMRAALEAKKSAASRL